MTLQTSIGASLAPADAPDHSDLKPVNHVRQIECIMPDGRVLPVSETDNNAPATVKDDAISCQLHEGKTVFIIAFPKTGLLDRLKFVNENASACGELKIAVSNYHLPVDSPAWTAVDGSIPFVRKRLFNLSMLGVAAKYVKLSFHVQKSEQMTGMIFDTRQLRQACNVAIN